MAAAELAGRGHSIWVCCPDLPHADQFISENRLIRNVPSGLGDTRGKADLAETMSKLNIDVVIPVSQRMYFLTGQIARRLNIAMVLRLGIVRLPWRPVLDWFGYGIWPDAIMVNTGRIKRVLSWAPFVKPDRIHVIYNGITEGVPVRNSHRDERFTISFVGTVSWRKGVSHLISALSYLPDDVLRKTRLQIIGTGPAMKKCRRLVAKLRLQDNVSFEGHLDNPSSRLADTDLFTLLSVQEGISNSLLEAMNAGVASYTTLAGGHGEFIRHGENAYVASSRNPKAVARDLRAIINDNDRARIAQAGRETVAKLFSTVSMGNQLEALLHSVIHTSHAPLAPALAHRSGLASPMNVAFERDTVHPGSDPWRG